VSVAAGVSWAGVMPVVTTVWDTWSVKATHPFLVMGRVKPPDARRVVRAGQPGRLVNW
jgi:hypothetical protein